MDPISSLKFALGPQMNLPYGNALSDVAVPKQVPLPEMETLSPASAPKPLDAAQPSYSFQNLLGDFVQDVSQKQATASDTVNGLLTGKNVPLHQAVISMEEASVSFQLMVEVRNRLLESYQELMRMQV